MDKQWLQQLVQQGAVLQHERVLHYGNLKDELAATLNQLIVTDLSYKGLVAVSGPDAHRFLQGQLTCDMRLVDQNRGLLAAHCNSKGRVVSSFRVFRHNDEYWLMMPAILTAATLAQLQKYARFSKVTLTQKNNELIPIGLSGPNADTLLQELFSQIPLHPDDQISENGSTVIKIPGPWPRYLIFSPWQQLQKLWPTIKQHARCCGADAWQLLNILQHIPTIYPATIGKFTPHQINLPALGAVSFNKGCYIGQEVVARMEHLGKLKSHLYRAHIASDTIPKPGYTVYTEINSEKIEVGTVVVGKSDPAGGYQLLVVMKDDFVKDHPCFIEDDKLCHLQFIEQ